MAEILDRGDFWLLIVNRNAKPVEEINEPSKGYKAVLGFDSELDKHVVMTVEYSKKMFGLDDVYKKVEQLRTCSKCNALDKEKLKLDRVQVDTSPSPPVINGVADSVPVRSAGVSPASSPSPSSPVFQGPDPFQPTQPIQPAQAQSTGSKFRVKDMFVDALFDAYFTRPGKYVLGLMTEDEDLLESALPKNMDETSQFMDELVDFMTGEAELVRSPEQAKEFFRALRTPSDEPAAAKKSKKKTTSPGIVIY